MMEEYFEHFVQLEDCIDEAVISETINTDSVAILTEILSDTTGIDKEKSKGIVNIISGTIDEIDKNYQDLQNYKANGGSTKGWISKVIEEADSKYDKTELVQHILTGIEAANQDIVNELHSNGSIEEPLLCKTEGDLGEYTGLNKRRYAEEITNAISCNTLLDSIKFKNGKLKILKECRENPILKQYFETPLNASGDSPIKKAVSIGIAIAREKNLLPKAMQKFSDEEIAYTVEQGLTRAKTLYKIGSGELSIVKGINHCIDRFVSIVGSVIKDICTKTGAVLGETFGKVGSELLFNKIGGKVASVAGKQVTEAAAFVGGVAGRKAGKAVGNVIAKGVKKVGDFAKTAVQTLAAGVKKGFNAAKNFVKSLF